MSALKKLPEEYGPRYQHDCNKCVFIGHRDTADVYLCVHQDRHTIIFRFSSEGSDYASQTLRHRENLVGLLEVTDHNMQVTK